MEQLPGLHQLMGAYFHQDWVEDHPDEWDVLTTFEEDEPDLAAQLPSEIDDVLRRFQTEAELEHFVVRVLGGDFDASYDGGTYRGWLTEIAARVRPATSG